LEPDDLLARFGGDEFVILIVQRHATDAAEVVAERVNRALSNPFAVDGYELHVSAGIGIARTHSGDCDSFDQLMAEADAALAESKQRGRGETTVFTPEIQDRLITRLQNENELRRALRNDELILHYQPKFDLRTNEVVGVEALVRWDHPRDGLLGPAAFVPLAEEAGLIETLGSWVLNRAIEQASAWLEAGDVAHPLALSVNVSAGQLAAGEFASDVQAALRQWKWPAQHLVIELTETSLMADCDHALEQLGELEAIGIRIAIDDFGTGYSSLSYLHRFPVEIVKLDRSFVVAIDNSRQGLAVPKAVATIAESLGLISVAEGIETAEQLDVALTRIRLGSRLPSVAAARRRCVRRPPARASTGLIPRALVRAGGHHAVTCYGPGDVAPARGDGPRHGSRRRDTRRVPRLREPARERRADRRTGDGLRGLALRRIRRAGVVANRVRPRRLPADLAPRSSP
jgi:predicted signal transduction protein with EAL and GGDEF domain